MRDGERVELGLLVDAVSEVIDIAADAIEPPPNFGTAVRRDFIRGMGKVGERFVIILEPDRAFDVDEMAAPVRAGPGRLRRLSRMTMNTLQRRHLPRHRGADARRRSACRSPTARSRWSRRAWRRASSSSGWTASRTTSR